MRRVALSLLLVNALAAGTSVHAQTTNDAVSSANTQGSNAQSETAPAQLPLSRTARRPRRISGRVAFSLYSSKIIGAQGTDARRFDQFVTSVRYQMTPTEPNDFDLRIDARLARYPGSERPGRSSVYEASVGRRFADGRFALRGGQMWLQNLGGLGSVGGVLGEYRARTSTPLGRPRFGVFTGLEPEILDAAYVSGVRKTGGYVAFEGSGRRRHAVGYVNIRHSGMTERSVVSLLNFVPIGQSFFLYQASQYDLSGSAGNGKGRLTYFLTNVRQKLGPITEVSGSFHRGRSIDARSVTNNLLAGRPVSDQMLEGLRFESASGRLTVRPVESVRVFLGLSRSKNDRADVSTRRTNVGGHVSDLLHSGLDVTVYQAWLDRGISQYKSWDISVGRQLGRRLYVRGDYSTSLSIFRVLSGSEYVIENSPPIRRFELSGNVSLPQRFSLVTTMSILRGDDADEHQWFFSLSRSF